MSSSLCFHLPSLAIATNYQLTIYQSLITMSSQLTSLKKKPTRQVTKLMSTALSCSELSVVYGQCVVKNHQNIAQNVCVEEFMAFKRCVQKGLGRSW